MLAGYFFANRIVQLTGIIGSVIGITLVGIVAAGLSWYLWSRWRADIPRLKSKGIEGSPQIRDQRLER